MKIGFDAKRLYNNFTGLGNYSRTTIDILTEYVPQNQYLLYSPSLTENHVTTPYLHHKLCKTITPSGLLKGSLWRTVGLSAAGHHDEIDLFHGLSNEIPFGLSSHNIPSVVTIHDVAFKTFPDMYHWHDRIIYHQKWNYACKHANHIIAISESTKKDIIRFYNVPEEKISVVYQPVNQTYYTPSENIQATDSTPYMLYVGSVNSRKNLLGIVRAMEQVPSDLQIPLTIVGNGGTYKHKVEEYIEMHQMTHLFKWVSAIDSAQLQQLYANAAVFLYPSFYEGFGLPVVEALLSCCPVITSNISSLPEAGGPSTLYVNPYDVEDIRNSIVNVLTDTTLRNKMTHDGYQYALNKLHPETLTHQLSEVYKKTINEYNN